MADHLLKYQTLLHYWFLLVTIRLLPPEKKVFYFDGMNYSWIEFD